MANRLKLATQVNAELLTQTRAIADAEGRPLESVVEEALADLVEKKANANPRAQVMAHYEASVTQFGLLYERLAK